MACDRSSSGKRRLLGCPRLPDTRLAGPSSSKAAHSRRTWRSERPMNSPAFACVSRPSTTCRTTARRSSSLLLISTSSWATDPPFRRRHVTESGHLYLARSGHFHFAAAAKGRISAVLSPGPPLAYRAPRLAERGGSRLNSAAQGAIRFVPLGAPPDSEVEAILRRIVVRLLPLLHARREAMETEQPDALASAQTETLLLPAAPKESLRRGRHSAFLEGFSLHAGVHLHANDREGLEKLCGYGARPPLSLKRLSALPDGRLAYRLKRPLGDGREVLALRPTELLRRLATLVPPPRHHLVRYHGVFGPNSAWRAEIVPRPPESGAAACHPAPVQPPPGESPASTAAERPSSGQQTRIPWSELLQRVFREDVLQCPCGGRRVVLAFLTDATVVKAMLEHLGLPATGPPIAHARPHEQPDFTTWQDDVPESQQALR